MLKRTLSLMLASLLVLCCFAGCSGQQTEDDGKLNVVCTVFPQYDWVRNIVGDMTDGAEITLLLDSGTDLHSYQPTAADIIKITTADLFIYVGGNSDKWVDDVFATSESDTVKLDLMEVLGESVFEEETAEGMEAEEEEEGIEYDEHVWLSLKNAVKLCGAIKDALAGTDPENSAAYAANCEKYINKLTALDKKYEEAVSAGKLDTILFADRFPFRYLVEDYGLNYYGAFTGCSSETEASFDTVTFLAGKTDELDLPVILVTETSDKSIADTVSAACKTAKPEILVMDAMQSVTKDRLEAGENYIGAMESNLEILKSALG